MRKLVLVSLAILTIFIFVTLAPRVYAQQQGDPEDPWVGTFDTTDSPKDEFLVDETVRIKAYSSRISYTIEVWTSIDGGGSWSKVKDISSSTTSYSGDHDDISTSPVGRRYELRLFYATTQYSIATYFVVPELPLGTMMATVASLGAVVGLATIKRIRPKLNK